MSRQPALGTGLVPRVAKAFQSERGRIARQKIGDNCTTIRSEQKKYPIGRTIKEKVFNVLGTSREQRQQNARALVYALYAKDSVLGAEEAQRRKYQAIKIAKAKEKAAKTFLTRRLL